MVDTKCESNPLGVLTCISCSGYRQEENKECSEKDMDNGRQWKSKRTWKKQVEEESVTVGLRREDALC